MGICTPFASIASVVAIDDHGTVVPVLDGLDRVQSTTNIAGDTFVFTNNGLIELLKRRSSWPSDVHLRCDLDRPAACTEER